MAKPLLMALLALYFGYVAAAPASVESFKFHVFNEPHDLDPQTSPSASGNYIFHNLYRGLYHYTSEKGLTLEGAKECKRSKLEMRCTLRDLKWSDGKPITSMDYVNSFRRLIDPELKSPQVDVLFPLKNARDIFNGKKKPSDLGLSAPDSRTLVFSFAEEDHEFEYRLIHPALSPLPEGGFREKKDAARMPTSGPYRITEWKAGAWIKMDPNLNYTLGNPKRPPTEAFFIEEDSTALRMFEAGKLSFNRRLVASEFPRFRNKPEFHQIPMARFDYIGFGPALLNQEKLRKAMVHSVEFDDFMRLFGARSPAGCPSLPRSYMDRTSCLKFNKELAKNLAGEVRLPAKLEFEFSRMGGDDIARAVEWFQGQWKKNIGLRVDLNGQEQAVYLRTLKSSTPAIFRKGVSLDRPTCLAALEIFSKGHPENYIKLDDQQFEARLDKLRHTKPSERKQRCREAVDYLMALNRLIPLGEMHFTVLANTKFKGWTLNELNQLDLSHLQGP